jgi:hypothetical protein
VISSAKDALAFMDTEWPADRGYLYNLARRKCEQNLNDATKWNAARLALQGAIAAVDMFPEREVAAKLASFPRV